MCNHCYHKYGRNSFADACAHTDRLVYAKGKCQNCYLNDYNKLKRKMKKDKATKGELALDQKQELPDAIEPSSKRMKK